MAETLLTFVIFFLQVGIHKAPFTHFMKQGLSSHFRPGSVYLPTKPHCWPPMARCMLSPQMGPDISHLGVHMTAHPLVWLSSSSAAWLCSPLRSLLASFLEATLAPPMCLPQAGLASLAAGFQKVPCLPHHKPTDTIITAHLPQQNISS